ncbi:MAG TPA: putative sugar nucleotidyl transferase, partial [Puia sp.]|nr:putative sugar nucleotidyl transferase [Puia sp.]
MDDTLFPFTATRAIADIRIGILTIREKEQHGSRGVLHWVPRLTQPWHIFQLNAEALVDDFALLTAGRASQPIPSSVQAIAGENIFIEEGATLQHCILNASNGPIYIGKGAEVMEGSLIRGPFALCEGATVKLGTKIYGGTTIGPHSLVGG